MILIYQADQPKRITCQTNPLPTMRMTILQVPTLRTGRLNAGRFGYFIWWRIGQLCGNVRALKALNCLHAFRISNLEFFNYSLLICFLMKQLAKTLPENFWKCSDRHLSPLMV